MTRKLRWLRILGALLVLILFVGYFAFSTFFFSPFESGIGVDLSGLVPRQVDFFVARAHLTDSFDDFPHLAVEDELLAHEAWETFSDSPEQIDLIAALDFERLLTEIETATAQLPLGLEPLSIFGGRDLAIAGNFQGSRIEDSQWALYANLSAAGKLAIEALDYPAMLGLEEQGITVTPGEGYVTLSGSGFTQPLHLTRVRDVGVLSNTPELLQAARDLEARQFEDSFLAGATYHDHIQLVERSAELDEFEIFVNSRALMEAMRLTGAWPDVKSQDFLPAFGARFFQLGTINQLAGVLGIHDGLTLDAHGELSSELLTPMQTRTYRQRATSSTTLLDDYTVYVPADTALFVYLQCDIGDLFEVIFAAMEPAARELVEGVLRETGRYRSLQQLIEEVDSALLDRCMLIVRENDYATTPDGPPHNDIPMPAVALVTWPAKPKAESKKKLDDIVAFIGGLGPRIGMAGKAGQSGFYSWEVGGHPGHELWFPQLDGTGHVGTLVREDICILSNVFRMLNHLNKTWTQGTAGGFPRLSERSDFAALVRSAEKGANLAVWYNPRAGAPILRERARLAATDSIDIDWAFERARNVDLVLRQSFAGRKAEELTPSETTELDRLVEEKLEEVEATFMREQVPALMADYERKIVYSEAIQGALLMLALDPSQFDLALRVMTPLGR